MRRSEIPTRPLAEVLLEADHDDLEFAPDPRGRTHLDRWVRKAHPAFDPTFEDPAVDRMREAWKRGTLLTEGGHSLFELRAGVGDDEANGRVDVAKLETLLEASGAYDLAALDGPTGFFAADKGDAVRAVQRANGISEDGKVTPRGATMRALKATVQPKIRDTVAANSKKSSGQDTSTEQSPSGKSAKTNIAQTSTTPDERRRKDEQEMSDLTLPMRVGTEGFREKRFPERAAFAETLGSWPDDEAWHEIEFAKANPNATIHPRMEASRVWAILNDRKAVFSIEDNPNEKYKPADHRDHSKGIAAVSRYDAVIAREATRQGVDPDLVRAIMYVENADGDPDGLNQLVEDAHLARSILPMNIKARRWAGMGGVKRDEFREPERNIRAGVAVIKAISDRLRPIDRTPAKIGTIWNFTGREKVNKIGLRVQRAYDEKAWRFLIDPRE